MTLASDAAGRPEEGDAKVPRGAVNTSGALHSGRLALLVGPLGALVDEVAGVLSARLGREVAIVSEGVRRITGMDPAEFVVRSSADELAAIEVAVAEALLEGVSADRPRILALGSASLGESMSDPKARRVRELVSTLRADGARVAYLNADLATMMKRNGLDGPRFASVVSPRPLMYTLLAGREAVYSKLADIAVDTSGRGPGEVADELARAL